MFSKKELIFIIGRHLLKATLVIILGAAVVVFSSGQISNISDSLVEKEALSFILKKGSETTARLQGEFAQVGKGEDMILNALPPVDNILGFVQALERLGQEQPVSQSVRFSGPVPAVEDVYEIAYNVNVEASISDFLEYLQALEALPYFSSVMSLSVQTPSSGSWEESSSIALTAKFYAR